MSQDDYEPITLLGLLLELSEREPTRFRYRGRQLEGDLWVHNLEIQVGAFEGATPMSISSDEEGGEVVNLYDLAMLGLLFELACQDHTFELQLTMTGSGEDAEYEVDLYDVHGNPLGNGVDSSREIALASAYLEAVSRFGTVRALDA